VLTGVVTSEGIGVRCGDALNEGGDRRLSQLFTPRAEAERLGFKQESQDFSLEWARIKTRSRFEELIRFKVAKSLKNLRTLEPRCRARNRRWRKSHHNKNLTAPCFLQREHEGFVKMNPVLTGRKG
jgi:hypothetical protein